MTTSLPVWSTIRPFLVVRKGALAAEEKVAVVVGVLKFFFPREKRWAKERSLSDSFIRLLSPLQRKKTRSNEKEKALLCREARSGGVPSESKEAAERENRGKREPRSLAPSLFRSEEGW